MRRRRAVIATLCCAFVGLVGACSSPPDPPTGQRPSGFALPPVTSASAPATTSSAPAAPWVPACTLLTDRDVLGTANGYGTQMTIERREPREEGTESDGRVSQCLYYLRGTKGNQSAGGTAISLRVEERAAPFYFPARGAEQTAAGFGDEAFWQDAQIPRLNVRIGERLYAFDCDLPLVDDSMPSTERDRIGREVIQKLAPIVLARAY